MTDSQNSAIERNSTTSQRISDVLSHPQAAYKCQTCKERLLARFYLSAQENLEKLQSLCGLGDSKNAETRNMIKREIGNIDNVSPY